MKDFIQLNHWIKTHGDLALDLLRIYLGIGLIIKAVFFVTHTEYLLNLMAGAGSWWFAPAILMHYIVLAHFYGGGRWSMDNWLAGKQHEKLFETDSHVTKPA